MSKPKKTTTTREGLGLFFVGIVLGVIIGWCIFSIEANKIEYDQDCLDKLANRICIEEGYANGHTFFSFSYDFECRENRETNSKFFKWLEGEKESCIIRDKTTEGELSKGTFQIRNITEEGMKCKILESNFSVCFSEDLLIPLGDDAYALHLPDNQRSPA